MRIVGDTKLVWDGQQQSVRLDDCLIFPKLFDKRIRLGSVATAEDRSRLLVQKANFVLVVTGAPKVKTILVVKQRKDTAADRNARSASVASFLPGSAKGSNLSGLLEVECFAGLIELKRRALHIHSQLRCPGGSCVRGRTPPDAISQSFGVRLKAEEARWIGKHRMRVRPGEALTLQKVDKCFGMPSRDIRISLALGGLI